MKEESLRLIRMERLPTFSFAEIAVRMRAGSDDFSTTIDENYSSASAHEHSIGTLRKFQTLNEPQPALQAGSDTLGSLSHSRGLDRLLGRALGIIIVKVARFLARLQHTNTS